MCLEAATSTAACMRCCADVHACTGRPAGSRATPPRPSDGDEVTPHPSPTPTEVGTVPTPQPSVHGACSEATCVELGWDSRADGSRAVCEETVDTPVLGGACVGAKRWG